MASDAQIDANRRNALKCTGPKTLAGKSKSRLNALWHGAFASDLVLPGEDAEAFHSLETQFRDFYQPASQAEEFLVNRMVLAAWRLQRLAAMENRVLRVQAGRCSDDADLLRSVKALVHDIEEDEDTEPEPPVLEDPLASAWIRDANGANAMVKLARYQVALERSFYRALHVLRTLRAEQSVGPDGCETGTVKLL